MDFPNFTGPAHCLGRDLESMSQLNCNSEPAKSVVNAIACRNSLLFCLACFATWKFLLLSFT